MKDLSGITFTIHALEKAYRFEKAYREKELSPVDVVREVFRRIEQSNDNPTWIHLVPEARVKGFLCESVAVQHAADISHFGGWRNYLSCLSSRS
jgi:hypothetical protein